MSVPLDVLSAVLAAVQGIPGVGQAQFYRTRPPELETVTTPYFEVRPVSESQSDDPYLCGDATQTVWTMTVAVFGGDKSAPAPDLAYAITRSTELRNGILKAVMADTTLGGVASGVEEGEVTWFPKAFQDFDASVAIAFNITYNHRSDDPDLQG